MRRLLTTLTVTALLLAGCGTAAPSRQAAAPPAPASAPDAAAPPPASGTAAPAPPPAPAPAPKADSARVVKAAATGDLLGDGRPLTVEVLAPADPPPFSWEGVLTLRVRENDRVLATAAATGSSVAAVSLLDFAGDHHPFIILTGKQEAVSDHSGFAQVFRFDGTALLAVALYTGWMGSAWVKTDAGPPTIGVSLRYEVFNPYIPVDLVCKPCARPFHTQTYGWRDGKLQLLSETSTRLAYGLYDNRDFERPLAPATEAQYNQGRDLLAAGKPTEAIPPLQSALKAEPEYPDALSDLALAYAQLGRWQESRDAAQQAVKLNPWHPQAQFNLGVALLKLNQPADAATALSIATGLQLDRREPHYWLAQAYEKQGKLKEAAAEYQAALDRTH